MEIKSKIAVAASCNSLMLKAKKLAWRLNLPFIVSDVASYPFLLMITPEHIELQETNVKNSKPIYVNFLSPSLDYRMRCGGGNKQLIAKAIGIKSGFRPSVLDVTAGFGVDAFVFASLGCDVVMLERSQVIGALLQDGLERFRREAQDQDVKIDLCVIDAADYLRGLSGQLRTKDKQQFIHATKVCPLSGPDTFPDVIYLDPMYPKRQKAALGKKTMRILHEIVGEDEDSTELLFLALKCAKKRVVVKRPSYARSLGTSKPDLKFSSGGSCRYDVYLVGVRF